MRVVFMSWRELSHPLAGGSEVLVDQLARGLLERGHDVELLCGGPVGSRPYGVTSTGGLYGQYLGAPARYFRSHRGSDLVVDVANGVPFLSPVWRSGVSLCLVNHVHTQHWALWFPPPVAAVGRGSEAWLLRNVYRNRVFVAVSDSTATALVGLGVDRERIRIVHNGVEPNGNGPGISRSEGPLGTLGPLRAQADEPLFLALGRLMPHKRFDILLRLWETVRPATGGRLVVVGDGPEMERLRAMAGPGVILPGRVPEQEKQRLLDRAWLLLHPSMVEGWGLVIMEAAVHGTPSLVFDAPGVRDSVVDGETGTLARSEADFVRSWVELTADHCRRESLGRRARDRAAEFPWSSTVDRFVEVAEEVVNGAG